MMAAMNDCCASSPINALDQHFDKQRAEEDALDYAENGLTARGEKMLAYLDLHGTGLNTALDIGCGAGGLHHELLLRHLVRSVQALDASNASISAAISSAGEMGIAEGIHYQAVDFARHPEVAERADVVLMDRVLCCYPELDALLKPAIEKSRQYLVISYPRESFWVRLYYRWRALVKSVQRSAFRLYYHEPKAIRAIAQAEGMQLVDEAIEDSWQIDVYKRQGHG